MLKHEKNHYTNYFWIFPSFGEWRDLKDKEKLPVIYV